LQVTPQNNVRLKNNKEIKSKFKKFTRYKKWEKPRSKSCFVSLLFTIAFHASRLSWKTASEVVRGISRSCGDFQFYDIG